MEEDKQSDEKEIRNGLIISGKKITSISGPVSFYYLRPTKQVYDDGNKEYFPLVVLFGDYHRSDKNYCEPCNCGYEYKGVKSNKPCCYKLDDNFFISKINRLASKYTVDFYTETSFGGTGIGFKGGMMKEFTTGRFLSCYNKKLKHLCAVGKNIRWQAGDIRMSGCDFEKITYEKGFERQHIITVSEKYMKNSYIEFQLSYLLVLLSNGDFEKFNKFIPKTFFGDVIYFRNFLMSIFDKKENKFNIEKFAKLFFSILTKDNSAIYKQVEKQTFRNFNEMKEWEDIYCRSLKNVIYNIYKTHDKLENMKYYMYYIPEYVSEKIQVDKNFKGFIELFMHSINSSFLDIYVISRMFKQPENGKRSDISFCYFGDSHIINIVHLLLSTGAYELVAFKNVDNKLDPSRCVNLNDIYVNLDEDLKE